MFTRMGGLGSLSVPGGKTGTGVHAAVGPKLRSEVLVSGGMISSPGCPGR
jgi:hypothetical protein